MAAEATDAAPVTLVPWDHDATIVGARAAASRSAFPEPVSLQRANTWKDTSELRAKAYLKHVARMNKAATLRAEWMQRRREFRRKAGKMREFVKADEPDHSMQFMEGRVRKFRPAAGALVGMGFSENAAILALEECGGSVEQAAGWLVSGSHTSTEGRRAKLLKYAAAISRLDSPATHTAATGEYPVDKDPGNVSDNPADGTWLLRPQCAISGMNAMFTLGTFLQEPLARREKQPVHTDSAAMKVKAYPNRLRNGLLIRTPDSPEARSYGAGIFDPDAAETLLSFCATQPSRAYVAVDRRMAESGQQPTWLAARGWQLVEDAVVLIADETFNYFVLYELPHALQEGDFIAFGPNASGMSWGESHTAYHHYFVLVAAEATDVVEVADSPGAASGGGAGHK